MFSPRKLSLNTIYVLALALVAALVVIAFISLTQLIATQRTSAAVVNISGRQRMLSQRTAFFAQRLVDTPADQRAPVRQTLTDAVTLMEKSHVGLLNGDAEMGLPGNPSAQAAALYFEAPTQLDQQVRAYVAKVKAFAQEPDANLTPDNEYLAYIIANAPKTLLTPLNAVVEVYQRESEAEIARLQWLLSITFGLILAVLGASWWLFRHIARRVRMVAQAASGMAAGRLDDHYALPTGNDEVGNMAHAFSNMSHTIRAQLAEQQRANDELRAASDTKVAKEYLEGVVRTYSAFANAVAQGDLTVRLDAGAGQDELTVLGHNLNRMVQGLHAITQQVQQANANIATAASEILAATTQQAASATEQSAAITQTTTTVEEVKAIAQQTAHQATQLTQQSHQMLDAVQQGTEAVAHTVDGMGLIRERVDSIAHTILALSEQTTAIGEITATVTDLAEQSNLLALNAAIEAARAGEQGKGFAVVAQHVRELAERSKSATAQVGQILNEIQRATSAAVMVTEEGTKGVTQGAELAGKAGKVIQQIAQQVETGAQANVQVAAAAQQQTAGMEQIGQAMGAIQQATTETLSSTRQAERAAKDLNALAQRLQQAVAAYQV